MVKIQADFNYTIVNQFTIKDGISTVIVQEVLRPNVCELTKPMQHY